MKSIRCKECGFLNWETQEACKRCQTSLLSAPVDAHTKVEPEPERTSSNRTGAQASSLAMSAAREPQRASEDACAPVTQPPASSTNEANVPVSAAVSLPAVAMDQHLRSHRRPAFIFGAIGLFLIMAAIPLLVVAWTP